MKTCNKQLIKELEQKQSVRMNEKLYAALEQKSLLQEELAAYREELKSLQQELHDAMKERDKECTGKV